MDQSNPALFCALKQDKTTGYAGGVKKLQLQEKSSFVIIKSPARHENKGGFFMNNSSLAHTKWECKYHVVFAPKYRRQIIYGKLKADNIWKIESRYRKNIKRNM